jgi:hypothetical protein
VVPSSCTGQFKRPVIGRPDWRRKKLASLSNHEPCSQVYVDHKWLVALRPGGIVMRIVGVAWYLCGLFCVAAIVESMITFVPEAQRMGTILLVALLILAALFGIGAAWLMFFRRRRPMSWVFTSKPLSTGMVCVAAILTIVILMSVAG